MSTSPLAGVTDTAADVWTTGASAVQDFAASAAGFAAEVAVAAVEQLEELPERVVGIAAAAKERIHPAPRRSVKPWLLVVTAIAAFVAVGWYLRRRSSNIGSNADMGIKTRSDPVGSQANRVAPVAG